MASYPTPPTTTVSHGSVRNAKRRRVQDSSEESSATTSTTTSRTGFTSEKYRTGAPPLQLLPLFSTEVLPTAPEKIAFENLLPKIMHILDTRNIQVDKRKVDLYHRTISGRPGPAVMDITVYIPTVWNDEANESWLLAVDDIRTQLVQVDIMKEVKVEIVSWQATSMRKVGAVEGDHPLVAAWPKIKPDMHAILAQHQKLHENWRTIDVVRLGFSASPPPLPIVVSVTVDWTLDPRDWLQAEDQIQDLLKNRGFPEVSVEFERGDFVFGLAPQFPLHNSTNEQEEDIIQLQYSERVSMGSEFGPARYFQRQPSGIMMNGPYATFGGYIVARQVNKPPKKLGLTNYHAVRETMEGFLYLDLNTKDPGQGATKAPAPIGGEVESK